MDLTPVCRESESYYIVEGRFCVTNLNMSMARKLETVTFRIDSALKTALAEAAAEESKPVGELLRELVRERVEQKRRR